MNKNLSNFFGRSSPPSTTEPDDYDDDGSKEHTGLLSQNHQSKRHSEHDSPHNLAEKSSNVGNDDSYCEGNTSILHSFYASPKETIIQRSQASIPGSSSSDQHSGRGSSVFNDDILQMWRHGKDNDDKGSGPSDKRQGLHSSLIIEDASPPLPSHPFVSREDLSASQRFGMDNISEGAFAVPSSLSNSQHLLPLSEGIELTGINVNSTSNASHTSVHTATNDTVPSDPKKKRWGPKTQKAAAGLVEHSTEHPPLIDHQLSHPPKQKPITNSTLFYSTGVQLVPTEGPHTQSNSSSSKVNKDSRPNSSTFELRSTPSSSTGFVSGLSSLRNSIMIPALPSNNNNYKSNKTSKAGSGLQNNSLAVSQSSLLEFADDHEPSKLRWGSPENSSSLAESPSISFFRNGSLPSRRNSGSSSAHSDRGHERPTRESYGYSASPKAHASPFDVGLGHKLSTSSSVVADRASSSRRQRVAKHNKAAHSLSILESEFQQLIQKQGQLSAHKTELCKELLSLYSRRNIGEQKQEEAAKAEQFDDADTAATTVCVVQERIQKLEAIYAKTDGELWKCKKRQDELAKSISEMHQEVLQEMEQMQQARENEIADCRAKMNKAFDREMDRIQAEREEIEKEKSDIALGQDFLEKNEAELLEHMEEETKTEQEEMNDLIVKQNATRAEIQELTQKLELLNSKDKELTRNINMLQKKINAIVKQFDDKASEASREKRELERRQLYIQRRTQDLERQEAGVQKTAHQAEAAQKEVQEEIKNIILQRDRLEQVRKLFEVERVTLQKLRLEEEAFREKEAGWNMRASSLMEELKGHEAKIEALTSRSSADQKAISDLQLALEATQKRMGTIESLKALSVQRRDFKQASRCSSELAKCRDTIGQQQAELEKLTIRISEPGVQEQLEALRQEYEKARTHARNEESNLSKEIQEATADILSRLDAFATVSSTAGSEDKQLKKDGDVVATTDGCNSAEHSTAAADPRVAAPAAMGQLSQLVLDELRREIKDLQELSRIRFGREEVVLVSAFLVQPANHPTTSTDTPEENSAASTAVTAVIENTETKKLALERDIQAAVAEESYEAAAELQAQLDAL